MCLKVSLKKVKQEKEGIEFKIEKFDKASKDLDKLLESQISDKSKKGLGYSAVPPPYHLIYNRTKKLDLSYSGLDEFKGPEFKGYGSEDRKKESNVVCDKKLDDSKENSNNSLVKEQVSKDTSRIINESVCTQEELNAGTSEEISQDCIVMPIWKDASYFDSPTQDVDNGEPNLHA
ncbi:hypothetical protein Tco_0901611 [Tanacetum coccineum]